MIQPDSIFTKTEYEIIPYLINNQWGNSLPILVVLKGLSSIIKSIPIIDVMATPYIPKKVNLFYYMIPTAFTYAICSEPKEFIQNARLLQLLKGYYKNMNKGYQIGINCGNQIEREKSIEFYTTALKKAERNKKTL